jgi:hypothetical protein
MLNGGHPVAGQSVGYPHHQADGLRPDVKSVVDALQRSVPAPRMHVLFGDTLAAKSKVTLAISKGRHHHQRDDGHSRLVNVEQLFL